MLTATANDREMVISEEAVTPQKTGTLGKVANVIWELLVLALLALNLVVMVNLGDLVARMERNMRLITPKVSSIEMETSEIQHNTAGLAR